MIHIKVYNTFLMIQQFLQLLRVFVTVFITSFNILTVIMCFVSKAGIGWIFFVTAMCLVCCACVSCDVSFVLCCVLCLACCVCCVCVCVYCVCRVLWVSVCFYISVWSYPLSCNASCQIMSPVSAKKTPDLQRRIIRIENPAPQSSKLMHGQGECDVCEINARFCKRHMCSQASTLNMGDGGASCKT